MTNQPSALVRTFTSILSHLSPLEILYQVYDFCVGALNTFQAFQAFCPFTQKHLKLV